MFGTPQPRKYTEIPESENSEMIKLQRIGHILLSVRDTGPGIPPDHLPLIFDRFYKVDASRKAAGGSGLGLSIVKTIVDDPIYLNVPFITSTHFKKQADSTGWNPRPCTAR